MEHHIYYNTLAVWYHIPGYFIHTTFEGDLTPPPMAAGGGDTDGGRPIVLQSATRWGHLTDGGEVAVVAANCWCCH